MAAHSWWSRWLARSRGADSLAPRPTERERERALLLEREELVQELAENRFLMEQWREEVLRARAALTGHIDDAVDAKLGYLLVDLSEPAAELLSAPAGAPIEPSSLAALLAVLRTYGLQPVGAVGERVAFDPDRHEPGGAVPAAGAPVDVIRVGIAFKDRPLRKPRVAPPRT